MEDRYQSITNVVRTHSLLQFGLSIFRRTFKSAPSTVGITTSATVPEACTYDVQTFNFWLLANEEFTVTPSSLRFLGNACANHYFAWSLLITASWERPGLQLPFRQRDSVHSSRFATEDTGSATGKEEKGETRFKGSRGNVVISLSLYSQLTNDTFQETADLASLINRLIESKTSIILHNGLLDLLYIYHNFIGPLPSSFASFTGQLCDLFPRVYDTKYIADYHTEESASYLEYLYYKWYLSSCLALKLTHASFSERNSQSSSLHVASPAVCTVVIAPEIWNHQAAATPSKQSCCVQYAVLTFHTYFFFLLI